MRFLNKLKLGSVRNQNLILYKIIFLVFSIYVWYTYEHYFPWYVYTIGIGIYLSYYILHRNNIVKYSHIADIFIIILFLFGKHLNSFGFATYLLLPVICRGTYQNTKNVDRYFAAEYIIALIILCLFPEFDGWIGVYHLLVPAIIVLIVNHQFTTRWDSDDFVAELLDLVDDYYTNDEPSYHVYRTVIQKYQRNGVVIQNFACFSADQNFSRLHLINSSSLIYKYQYDLNEETKLTMKKYGYSFNVTISLDGFNYPRNLVYAVPQYSEGEIVNYVMFVLFFGYEQQLKLIVSQLNDLERFFIKLSKIITFESEIRVKRNEEIQNLQQKSRFVNAAINTMHFIKNRLTPFQTLLDYLNNEGDIQSFEKYPILLESAKSSCKREMNDILVRAKFLLDKGNNPFQYQVLTSTDSRSVYTLLRTIWNGAFPEDFDNLINAGKEHCDVMVNIEGIDVLLSDIIGNIKKYSLVKRFCIFDVKEDKLEINFFNDIYDDPSVEALVKYMNGDEKDEVLFRVTHGTPLIKQNCRDQKIDLRADIKTDNGIKLYNLKLSIKSVQHD